MGDWTTWASNECRVRQKLEVVGQPCLPRSSKLLLRYRVADKEPAYCKATPLPPDFEALGFSGFILRQYPWLSHGKLCAEH